MRLWALESIKLLSELQRCAQCTDLGMAETCSDYMPSAQAWSHQPGFPPPSEPTTFECSVANAGWLALPMTCNEQKLAKALSSVCTTDSETVKCCIAYVTEASALIFGNAAAHCKLGQPYPQSVPSSLECFSFPSEADTKRSDSIKDGRVG